MQKKITLSFDMMWVLSKKDDEKLPVELVADAVKNVLNGEILYTSPTDCEFVLSTDSDQDESVKAKVFDLLKKLFANEDLGKIVEYDASDYQTKKAEPTSTQKTANFSLPENTEEKVECGIDTVMKKIQALVGAEEFKALADEYQKIAPGLLKYHTVETLSHRAYLFSINDGDGMTTYLNLFAELLAALNLFNFDQKRPVAEVKVRLPKSGSLNSPFDPVFTNLGRASARGGRIVGVDISEWMDRISDAEFRDFLAELDDQMGENIIVFRVPFLEKKTLNSLKKSLGDMLYIRDLSFVPFDQDELCSYAKNRLESYGFTIEEDALDIYQARIIEEKIDGRFYGINTLNNVIREMLYKKQLDNALNGVDDCVVKKDEILTLCESYGDHTKTGEELLSDLIGIENIRTKLDEIVCQIEARMKFPKLGAPCIHMRFVGNPGTGKTTVARALGKILKEKGILRNGHFFEYSGRDFCGQFVGSTAPKTSAMCRDAYGSVLFIDEAYSLYRNESSGSVDYGREAIDTLIAEMENHRTDLVVIMAGYTEEMGVLMKSNPGLESRMPFVIEFPNYTRDQLYQIYMSMVNKVFTYGEGFDVAVKDFFDTLPDEILLSKSFSNARFVRNLYERTWCKAFMRAQLNKEDPSVLTRQDFLAASVENEFEKMMKKQSRTLGLI